MSINARTYFINSHFLIKPDDNLNKELKRYGISIKQDASSDPSFRYRNLNNKTIMLFDYFHGEKIDFRYKKYEYSDLMISSTEGKLPDDRIYTYFLDYDFNSFEAWMKFPFKPEMGLFPRTTTGTLGQIEEFKEEIREIRTKLKDSIEKRKAYLEAYLETSFYPTIIKNKYKIEIECYKFDNWEQFMFFEIYEDMQKNIRVNKCKTCGKPIYIDKSAHVDRVQHTKNENPECFREYERLRKKGLSK